MTCPIKRLVEACDKYAREKEAQEKWSVATLKTLYEQQGTLSIKETCFLEDFVLRHNIEIDDWS